MQNDPKRIELVVTLIHGTFARGAAWTFEGSFFATQLRENLQTRFSIDGHEVSIVFRRFDWSGKNSHYERIWAGEDLGFHLEKKVFPEFPSAIHILVGHSHGGNVACYAMRSPAVSERIGAIVCLGTPFIHCKPRKTGLFTLPNFLCAVGFYQGAAWMLNIPFGDKLPATFPKWLYGFEIVGLAYLWVDLAINPLREGLGGLDSVVYADADIVGKVQDEIIDRFALPAFTTPIMCIESRIQEARFWLQFGRFVCNIPFFLWYPGIIVLFIFLFFDLIEYVPLNILVMLVLGAAFSWLALLTNVAATLLLRGRQFSFGGESMRDNIYTDIFVDVVPPHIDRAALKVCNVSRRGKLFALEHCLLYESQDAIDATTQWLFEKVS